MLSKELRFRQLRFGSRHTTEFMLKPIIAGRDDAIAGSAGSAGSAGGSPSIRWALASLSLSMLLSSLGTIIAREAEHATEVTVRLAEERGAKAVVCGTEKRRENLRSRMSKPKRIQRSRAKGWKMPANAIYVGRPTVWGNPYVVGSELMNGETLTAEKAVALYEQHLADNFSERDIRHCLHDKDLACWCALDEPCHADVLLRIANSRPK